MSSPQTFWRPRAVSVQTRAYALEKPVSEGRIVSFFGLGKGHYEFEVSADFFHWASLGTLGHENVFEAFSWKSLDLKKDSYETPIRYLRVKSQPKENDATALFEIGIIDSNTQEIVKLRRLPSQDAAVKIKTDSVDAVAHDAVAEIIDEITDEPHLIVTHPDFMNEMIFDEVYHVRSAYEEILGERITETTHPPFGKTLISAGISLVGLNPFGWRFAGTLAGVLMIPLLYGFARVLTGSAFIATLAAFFFSFDFMRYTQTRLATLDGLALFFILLTMICLVIYGRRLCDPLDASVRISKYGLYKYGLYRLVPLFFCGTFFGVGLATKWSVLYLAPVLVVCIFTFALTYALLEKNRALDQGLNEVVSAGFSNKVSRGVNWFLKDGLFTVFALLIWPAILYYLAFWLSHYRSGEGYSLKDFWDRQVGMYRYHSELVATHPFSSRFWEWPVMKRPLWIYSGKAMDDGSGRLLAKSIVSFGNPLLWWSAIPAFFWGAYKLVRKFELSLFVLLITITGLYLPWIIAPRKLTFIYHFFPIVPFMLLLLAWVISQQIDPKSIKKNKTWGSVPVMAFCSVTVLLFLAFFPVLNGLAVYKDYVSFYLRWFSSWIF